MSKVMDFFNGHLGNWGKYKSDELCETWDEQDCIIYESQKTLLLGKVLHLSSWWIGLNINAVLLM